MDQNSGDGEGDDDDEWEDASDGEEDEEAAEEKNNSERDSRGHEERDKSEDGSSASPKPRPQTPAAAASPKEQRTARPKVHIPSPSPAAAPEAAEGGKPLSPFYPLEGHQPVSDWGEEMEMLSPRSSLGGESPLKPLSAESSPAQKKDQEEEGKKTEGQDGSSSEPAGPQREEQTGGTQFYSPSGVSPVVLLSLVELRDKNVLESSLVPLNYC